MSTEPDLQIDTVLVTNTCDPAIFGPNGCSALTETTKEEVTVKTQHNWSNVFKAGVSYSEKASAKVMGIGFESTVTVSFEFSHSSGGFKEIDKTLSSTLQCTANPMTVQTCYYVAWRGEIEEDYTIYWKNASPTHGTYKGTGYIVRLLQHTDPYISN